MYAMPIITNEVNIDSPIIVCCFLVIVAKVYKPHIIGK